MDATLGRLIRSDDIRTSRLLASLPADAQAVLAPQLAFVTLTRGFVLELLGEPTAHVQFPCGGALVSMQQTMQDGAAVEVVAIGAEGAVGSMAALGSGVALAQAVVQLPGVFGRIPMAPFLAALRAQPVLRATMTRYNELLIAEMQQSIACNALHDVESRLCRWLLQMQDHTGADVLPFTQEMVGQMLGVRRATITLVARLLQSGDMIRWIRGKVEILDRDALERAACECHAASRQRTDRFLGGGEPMMRTLRLSGADASAAGGAAPP
ncbi:MAG TPA: Crp/Fnr family transcriptional regulator [Xanthobacteraceae bacterium]|nr:Crp/Fnr family transcriptional regulator [Xanthobacteraceae bacterium]